MRILAILRLYSGFEESLSAGNWRPQGLPSIYKWISVLDKRSELMLTFTAKDSGSTYKSNWLYPDDRVIDIGNFKSPITILTGTRYFSRLLPRKIAMVLRECRQTLIVVLKCYQTKPDIVYLDSANLLMGAVIARLFPNKPVVIRVLGVCSWWWTIIDSKRLIDRLYKYVYRTTRFALLVGTQDGSGTEYWFEKVLHHSTPRAVMLNGVDLKRSDDHEAKSLTSVFTQMRQSGWRVILFVGRLESYKGVEYFLDEMIDLLATANLRVHVILIGSGNLLECSKHRVSAAGCAAAFSFLGSIPHEYILNFHDIADIYVSTNFDGNLTNSNLEAIACGDCILIPRPVTNEYVDRQTIKWLDGSVCFYDRTGQQSLGKRVRSLLEEDGAIEGYKRRLTEAKKRFLRTWDERFDEEFRMLCDLLPHKKPPTRSFRGIRK